MEQDGSLYGTTSMGVNQLCNFGNGNVGCGTIFELVPPTRKGTAWGKTILHRFEDSDDGANPSSGLIADATGALYGVAAGGGSQQDGVVFRLTKKKDQGWVGDLIHTFTDNTHGRAPSGPVTFDSAGNLYGPAGGVNIFWELYIGWRRRHRAATPGATVCPMSSRALLMVRNPTLA